MGIWHTNGQKVKTVPIHITSVMKYPSLRNPDGFSDIFPITLGYIVLLWTFIQTFDNIHAQRVIVLGSIIMLGWAGWAILSILEADTEERGE